MVVAPGVGNSTSRHAWLLLGCLWIGAAICQAQGTDVQPLDRVRVRLAPAPGDSGWLGSRVKEYAGTLSQLDESELVLERPDAEPLRVPSQQVEAVQIGWYEPAVVAAMELARRGEHRAAVTALDEARRGLPVWKQRFVIESIVNSALALDNPRTAGILFLNLAQSKPPQLLYAAMPLCWTARDVDKPLADAAMGWLKSEDEAARLLGASWLIFAPEREQAIKTLGQLRASKNTAIAQQAVAQGWRLVPPPETMASLDEWLRFRDQMLESLQLGPTEFLADRLQRIGELDLAMGEWSRIASQHAERYDRARRALQTAAENLARAQRSAEADLVKNWIDQLEGS